MINRTLWRLARKSILRNPLLNLLIFLQMTAAFFIIISLTSGICSRFETYLPFRELLETDGQFYDLIYAQEPLTGHALMRSELMQHLQGSPEIIGTAVPWLQYLRNGQAVENAQFLAYDDALLSCYVPELDAGEWFSADSMKLGRIPVVVSQNPYGLQPGDSVSFLPFGDAHELEGVVIGVMKDGAEYISCTHPKNEAFSSKNLFTSWYADIEEKTLFLFPQRAIEETGTVLYQFHGPCFVRFPSADAEAKQNRQYMKQIANTVTLDFAALRENSMEYIFAQCRLLLPILIAVMTMTVVGAMSVNALLAKRGLRSYAVFYICGLKWRQCAFISLISSLMIGLAALTVTVCGTAVLRHTPLLADSVIRLGWVQFAALFAALLIYAGFAVLLPVRLLRRQTPVRVLTEN